MRRRSRPCPQPLRFHAAWLTVLLVTCALGAANGADQSGRLLLLTGTYLNDAGQTFPVRLYTVDSRQRLKLFREVVSGQEGLYEVLDDTGDKIYVAFPYFNGRSEAPTTVSIIHKERPRQNDAVVFNPNGIYLWPRATATAAGAVHQSCALFTLFPESVVHVDQHAAFMRLIRSTATTLVSIAGNRPTKGSRVTRNDWSLYRNLTFYGSPGGPGQYFTPQAVIQKGDLVMHLGGKTIFVDHAPKIRTAREAPQTIWILAANREFLVSIPLGNGRENLAAPAPATIYVHNRRLDTWREIKSAGNMPQCRIFGPWLATMVRKGVGPNRGPDTNPGHEDERDQWVPHLLPNVREEFGSIDFVFYIPGIFYLDNLVDGRRITLQTNMEDSEILDVRKDGLVLYRVNNEIFSAQIEGDKLSAPTLVVKGDDVPEVHWAFWSMAGARPDSSVHSSDRH